MKPIGIHCARTTSHEGGPLGTAAKAIREAVLDDLVHRYDG